VYQLAAADDGRHVLVGGHDGAVRLYRLPDFGFQPTPPAPAGADGTVTAWGLPAAPAPAPRNQSP
jgi:hypothetical protein